MNLTGMSFEELMDEAYDMPGERLSWSCWSRRYGWQMLQEISIRALRPAAKS